MKQRDKKVLKLALYAGEIMLKNGAETYRVEDTIIRICKSCNIPLVETFVTPTGMFISIDNGSHESDTHTFIKRIKSRGFDLSKVSQINQFSRQFATTDLSIDEGVRILEAIDESPIYPLIPRVLGAGVIAAFFTVMFAGNLRDFISAFIVGIGIYLISQFLTFVNINDFIRILLCSASAAVFALLCVTFTLGDHLNPIIIGSIMILLPGVAITNAIRDSISGDILSGLCRAAEAFLTAVSIAVGIGIVIKIWHLVLGGIL